MNRIILVALTLALLSSCDALEEESGEAKPPREITLNAPEALKGCRTFHVYTTTPGYPSMIITRCPSSITTTRTEDGNVTVSEHAEEEN